MTQWLIVVSPILADDFAFEDTTNYFDGTPMPGEIVHIVHPNGETMEAVVKSREHWGWAAEWQSGAAGLLHVTATPDAQADWRRWNAEHDTE